MYNLVEGSKGLYIWVVAFGTSSSLTLQFLGLAGSKTSKLIYTYLSIYVSTHLSIYPSMSVYSDFLPQLALTGNAMPFAKMFVDQFTYWAVSINTLYLFR